MELPKPPEDQELRNIVDKLAQFVARNGPEFEQMTKNKQKDNPKFAFLFGGEYFNYYQYKVTTEQASEFILKQKQKALEQQQAIVQQAITRQSIKSAPWQAALQQQQMQEQIQQSDRNLAAQHHVLMQQQQVQVDDVIRKAQEENLHVIAAECDLDLQEMDRIMQPIIDSCTKDAISAGKGWIFSHSNNIKSNSVIARYLLRRVTTLGTSFELKLHLVYLINDVLHHCMRKGAEQLKKALEKTVVPIFCTTSLGASEEQKQKLAKLLKLWESNKYFEPAILEQLKTPAASLAAYQALLITEHAKLVTPIVTVIQNQYAALQKQHQEFVAHVTAQMQQILQTGTGAGASGGAPAGVQPVVPSDMASQTAASINALVATLSKVSAGMSPPTTSDAGAPATTAPTKPTTGAVAPSTTNQQLPALQQPPPPLLPFAQQPSLPLSQPQQPFMQPPPNFAQPPPNFAQPPPGFPPNFPISSVPPNYTQPPISMPPPPYGPGMDPPPPFSAIPQQQNGLPLPDLSKPPPGFPPVGVAASPLLPLPLPPPLPPPDPIELLPAVPYFELPAALMVPLVKLEDDEYKALDPNDIRLPPPAPPSERLLAAVELFYSPPGHDRPRNRNWENRENCDVKSNYVATSREGWEQLGLYEFFKAKHQAKKVKEDEIREGRRQRSRSRSTSAERTNSYRRAQSRSPPRRRYREFTSRSKSRSKSRSRSRSQSPSRSRSQSRSPSVSPVRQLVAAGSESQSPSRSRSTSPVTSPSQPSFKQQRPPSSRSPSRSRSRSTSKSPSPSRAAQTSRSPTPPSFFGGAYPTSSMDRRLDESNIGHQLLKKMGWGGAGLGAAEQGIQDPISGGEIRDRQDQYKGIGISLNDPFENFRKSKGQAFINRMKARAEEKTT